MKTIFSFFFIVITQVALASTNYYSNKSVEADLTFKATIEILSATPLTAESVEVETGIRDQLNHLIGYFQSSSFLKEFKYPGTINDQRSVKILSIGEFAAGKQTVTYEYKGRALFHQAVFGNKSKIGLSIRLPLNPKTIYNMGLGRRGNLCTSPDFNAAEDYFFFWDTELRGCPLRGNTEQVPVIKVEALKRANTTRTYPEYDRLYNSPELKIAVFVGYLNQIYPNQVNRGDDGYGSFAEIRNSLTSSGFKVIESKDFGPNLLTKLEKTLTNKLGVRQKITISMLLADTNSKDDKTFEDAYTAALTDAQIVTYDGHSGAGGYLHLDRFKDLKLTDLYQIYFINGCSTYSFFNELYLSSKPGGAKNLEIITAGLLTYPDTSATNMMAFLGPFIEGELKSYQTLLDDLEQSNDGEGTYLMGVNGDEDNVFQGEK